VHISVAKGVFVRVILVAVFAVLWCPSVFAQSPTGSIGGIVFDPDAKTIPGAEIIVVNGLTRVQYETKTNDLGIYALPNLPPGPYRVQASKVGFKTLIKPDIVLNVQESISINFTLPVGATSITVTVEGGAPMIDTTDATVSTVVDRQFAENLPLNGRSFQSLIQITPGVVVTPSNYNDNGQFSVNGQRASSNYWMVDGVSANIGIGVNQTSYAGNGLAGALGSFSAMGGTNSLVSVDALQEFRIQTSTYAPEFGRTPGGQISIVTRSGTNKIHGTLFDYFRNDALDASDWFNGYKNSPPLPKAKERQNDFGGTFSGPVVRDRAFFFFSYEGLRLNLPQTTLTTVPDANPADPYARQNAIPALQPYLNAFPLPNGPQAVDAQGNPIPGAFDFNASYSNRATLDAYSIRMDYKWNASLILFGRFNYSPSANNLRGNGGALSVVSPTGVSTQTATVGATWLISPHVNDDLRFNYSRTNAFNHSYLDNFGGAVPLESLPFPGTLTPKNAQFTFYIFSLQQGYLNVGQNQHNLQRQINIVDSLAAQRGSHSLKFGLDFRRLSPLYSPYEYLQEPLFLSVPDAQSGNLLQGLIFSGLRPTFLFRNLGIYAQDTWRILPRLTVTYGLRWDVDFVPESSPTFPAVTGFDLNNLSGLALASLGTAPFSTRYGNIAPRLGVAYQLSQSQRWQRVLRGGFGVFYDLASSELGNLIGAGRYPFGGLTLTGGTFPFDPAIIAPPPIVSPSASNGATLYAFDPHLQLPYTLEWNVALEQALGNQQTLSASYVGANGRRLIQTADVNSPGPNLASTELVTNTGTASYDALQVQFQRRLLRGFQALASYAWSHSIDTGSAGSGALASNTFVPAALSSNRASSDFDIRNVVSAGLTYDIPVLHGKALVRSILGDWALQTILHVSSAPPVDVSDANFSQLNGGFFADVRPDLVPGKPLYLYGPQYPGGRAFNPGAFTDPPVDSSTGLPLRQGNVPRNVLRGFGATQWDFAVHRDFPLHESLRLQFRAEMFNVLNHPNFGPPLGAFGQGGFGLSSQMLGQSLNGGSSGLSNSGGGGFDPLYQLGGPRSIQLALKFAF
jgi:hypothetical protein